ncbi:MAG: hypothetical protein K2H45_12945, partial [Acetatifactor sp.]|nr:hypothetical protein [Acetatifactor sp.]
IPQPRSQYQGMIPIGIGHEQEKKEDSRNDALQEAFELISGLDQEELVQFLELARKITGKA